MYKVEDPILSICVPSFNREYGILNLLQKFQSIPNYIAKKIEISFRDNSSDDKIYKLITKWASKQKKFFAISINKNKSNIGASQNIIKLLQQAISKYSIVIGDDDDIQIENLEKLVLCLTKDLFQGALVLTKSVQLRHITGIELRLLLIVDGLQPLGFIGNHVFNTQQIKKTLAVISNKKILTGWPHIYLFLVLALAKGAVFLPGQVVLKKKVKDENIWYPFDWITLILYRQNILKLAKKNLGLPFYLLLSVRQFFSKQLQYNILQETIFRHLKKGECSYRNKQDPWNPHKSKIRFFLFFTEIEMKILKTIPYELYYVFFLLINKKKYITHIQQVLSLRPASYLTRKL